MRFRHAALWLGVALAAAVLPTFSNANLASAVAGPPFFCLYNAQEQCANVKNDNYVLGQQLDIYNDDSGNGTQFIYHQVAQVCNNNSCPEGGPWPFQPGSGYNNTYNGDWVVYFDTGNVNGQDWCLGEESGNAELRGCPNGYDEGGTGAFLVTCCNGGIPPNFFLDVQRTENQGHPEYLSAASSNNGADLSFQKNNDAYWQQWIPQPNG